MKESLYTLTNEFNEMLAQLEEMEIDPEVLKDTLDSLQAPIEEKVENIIKYSRSLLALADAKKLEAKKLSDSASKDLKKAEMLNKYLEENLRKANIKTLQAGIFSLGWRKGSEVVEIDESKLPENYWKVEEVRKPMSKPDLKLRLKSGVEIPGVSLIRKEDTLVVK